MRPDKIISGGQTGVDRGALDAAIERGVAHGGWCPAGRRAEDGSIPDRYLLSETESAKYRVRTERNVQESDGTLILARGRLKGGTRLSREFAVKHAKPCLLVNLDREPDLDVVRRWIDDYEIATLNVAGPRESQQPGIAADARQFIASLLSG